MSDDHVMTNLNIQISSDSWRSSADGSNAAFYHSFRQQPKSGSGQKRPVRCRNISIISLFAVIIAAVAVTIVVLMLVKKDKEDGSPGIKYYQAILYTLTGHTLTDT